MSVILGDIFLSCGLEQNNPEAFVGYSGDPAVISGYSENRSGKRDFRKLWKLLRTILSFAA
jgi:hypothetical protein